MKRSNPDIEKKTKKFIRQTSLDSPGEDFTSSVMRRVEKEKVYGINKRENNVWQIIIAVAMPIAYFAYQFLVNKGETTFTQIIKELESATYISFIKTFLETLINDISFSPFIYMSIFAIATLVIFDRFIVKLLHNYSHKIKILF